MNKNENLLTRFINIETLSFQSMLQAGRWQMHGIATLPGTNYVIWTRLIHELNGWDEEALTEDSELSVRIYELGYKIKFIPYAITYEQEPQEWKVWVKQRMRWVRGNNYVISKFFKHIPRFKNKRLGFDLLYTLLLYYVFFAAILISDVLFILTNDEWYDRTAAADQHFQFSVMRAVENGVWVARAAVASGHDAVTSIHAVLEKSRRELADSFFSMTRDGELMKAPPDKVEKMAEEMYKKSESPDLVWEELTSKDNQKTGPEGGTEAAEDTGKEEGGGEAGEHGGL